MSLLQCHEKLGKRIDDRKLVSFGLLLTHCGTAVQALLGQRKFFRL